jgi:hypothetical protein
MVWSHDSWIYYYICIQCLSPLTLWVQIPFRWSILDTTLCDKVCQWLATGQWFSLGTPVSSTNKTDRHDITEILLKVVLNTINPYLKPTSVNKAAQYNPSKPNFGTEKKWLYKICRSRLSVWSVMVIVLQLSKDNSLKTWCLLCKSVMLM